MRLRTVLKAAVLSAVAVAPGQAAPSGGTPPDFSGIWAHPWLPGFEALASGPTALVNLSRTPEGRSIQTRLVGDDINGTLDTSNNDATFRAERFVLAEWDTALQKAVLVNWTP